jgi:hypothetical protein
MTTIPDMTGPLAAALAGAQARVAAALAADLPDDVRLAQDGQGLHLTGHALSTRALTDPRLRDFAGLVR